MGSHTPPSRSATLCSTLDALERYAHAFDEISDEQDAHYSARSFVRSVRLETTTPRNSEQQSRDRDETA